MGLFDLILQEQKRKKSFFTENCNEIAQQNVRMLQVISLVTAALLAALVLLSVFVIKGWNITLYHIAFFPASFLFYILAVLYRKYGRSSPTVVKYLTASFCIMVFVFVTLIDVFSDPAAPGCFTPTIYVAISVIFVTKPLHHFLFLCGVEIWYVCTILAFKDPFIAQYDIFNSITGMFLSVVVSEVVIHYRLHDYEQQKKYHRLSKMDLLSGILNKRAFEDHAKEYLKLKGENVSCALLMIDIDHFKQINDQYGHYTGDQVITIVGDLMENIFRASDFVARFGGDEFMVLARDFSDREALYRKCEELRSAFTMATSNCGIENITCSIGGTIVAGRTTSYDAMLRQADKALYEAKKNGRDQTVLEDFV